MANGKFGGGNGTAAAPFLIEDADDLNAMRKYLSSYFKLANDINMNVYPYNVHEGWQPIMNFTGNLNGNRHTIFNLYINRPNEDNIGLFGYNGQRRDLITFSVYDLALENIDITGRNYVGGILGRYQCPWVGQSTAHNGKFSNMFVRVQVSGEIKGNRYVGGILGYLYDGDFYPGGVWEQRTMLNHCITACKLTATGGSYQEICGAIGVMIFKSTKFTNNNVLSFCYSGNTKGVQSVTCKWFKSDHCWRDDLDKDSTCYADRTINPLLSKYTNSLTTQEWKSGNHPTLATWKNVQANGYPIYRIEKGKYPRLSFVGQDYYLARTPKGAYLTFDFDKNEWKKISDTQPNMTLATRYGMNSLKNLTKKHWEMLKDEGEVDLVNYRPQVNSVDTIDKIKTMVDSSSEVGNNIVLRKSFGFNSNDDEIINISPVI